MRQKWVTYGKNKKAVKLTAFEIGVIIIFSTIFTVVGDIFIRKIRI